MLVGVVWLVGVGNVVQCTVTGGVNLMHFGWLEDQNYPFWDISGLSLQDYIHYDVM